jgi:HEAT repeat protein
VTLPALRDVLRSGSTSPPAATSAAWILGALHARGQAQEIVDAMRRGALPPAAAMHALAGAGTEASVPVVLEFITDPGSVVRDEALAAALALVDPAHADGRAVEPLTAALRDGHLTEPERLQAIALLGRTGAVRAAPFLVGLASSRDTPLRIAAIDALSSLGAGAAAADEVLLHGLDDADARVRLRAAVALSETGSAKATDELVAKLDGGDEIDRSAVLTALAGVLSRWPTDAAVSRVATHLALAAGAERDALIEVLGLPSLGSAVGALASVASSSTPEDRRTAAALCAAHPGEARVIGLARTLLVDTDPATRTQAAWALGTVGDASDLDRLAARVRSDDADAAANAVAAMGRILARGGAPGTTSKWLCPLLGDRRPFVRANALASLALGQARCGDGAAERAALAADRSEDVRAAAALAVRSGGDDDRRALERCRREELSGRIAALCRSATAPQSRGRGGTRRTLVYVVPEGAEAPRPGAPYALVYPDGMVRMGLADRRGALVDPAAPDGDLRLTAAGR